MNEAIEALILGIIQGLTEFLPVSSSGHLEIAQYMTGEKPKPGTSAIMMTVVLHAATALSTIVVFRKEILELLKGLFQFKWNEESIFSAKIILSMIPAAFIGVFFDKEIEAFFTQQIVLIGGMLLVTGFILFLADKAKTTSKGVTFSNSIIIGIAQAIAIIPGISRSGATIGTSVLLGIDREKAAKFSFLMVVPLILGKMAKTIIDGDFAAENVSIPPLIIGFIAAFITGVVACVWMIKLVKRSKLKYFAYYCFAVGIVALVVGLS